MELKYICQYCNKECKNINSHKAHERLCPLNPNRNYVSHTLGKTAWNKGLTKETDERVKQFGQTYSNRIKNKEISAPFAGKKHTDEWRKNHSELQKERYKGKTIYATIREHRKSYAEQYFNEIFTNAEKQYHVDRYFLDYAWPDIKVYIEVDGEQHYTKDGIEHDKIRTDFLIEKGWRLLKRIRWSEFQKLSKIEKENEIYRLLQTIKIQENFPA